MSTKMKSRKDVGVVQNLSPEVRARLMKMLDAIEVLLQEVWRMIEPQKGEHGKA